MNGKRAKAIRRLAKFKPFDAREYGPAQLQDHNGKPYEDPRTKVAKGARRDYKILKDYFQGKDVILPHHLRGVVNV